MSNGNSPTSESPTSPTDLAGYRTGRQSYVRDTFGPFTKDLIAQALAEHERRVPRWQQGWPRLGYEDAWNAMSPRERRRAFVWDVVIGLLGSAAVYGLATWLG